MSESIDLLLFQTPQRAVQNPLWPHGETISRGGEVSEIAAQLWRHAQNSSAEFLLLWRDDVPLPDARIIATLIDSGADAAHAGLAQNLGRAWPDLNLVMQNWSMINAPKNIASTSWRLGLDSCLLRREALLQSGGLDGAFQTKIGAGLELGFRLLKLGAIVEHRPELEAPRNSGASTRAALRRDFYLFLLRHYGTRWAQYALARRGVSRLSPRSELVAFRAAQVASTRESAQGETPRGAAMWFSRTPRFDVKNADVSVIIPTLGRYPFLPGALDSLRRQTVRPREVIVVDQNSPEEREPQTYQGYEDLNLRVIYQDERGQSLARNGGVGTARGEWILLFEDDAVASDDLIEAHLNLLSDERFQVSSGVVRDRTWDHELPPGFGFPRVAQTFPTGNALLRTSTMRALGGLDRNYDFGPATDLDFGTRLYLSGARIALNPRATMLHFKASMGGLRVHGAKKYNTDSKLLAPFPPATLSYYGLRFLNRQQRRERLLLGFATAKISGELRRGSRLQQLRGVGVLLSQVALLPLKNRRSQKQARVLLRRGPQLLRASTRDTKENQ